MTLAGTIPIRLQPLPGEALDSWLETYAHLLHVTVNDIFRHAGLVWESAEHLAGRRPWLYRLGGPAQAAISAVSGIPASTLLAMTLASYDGTGLAASSAGPGSWHGPRWWLHLARSQFCPRCLAGNGGRSMLAWRLPWTFACTSCQVLLADACPDCGRPHPHTRTGQHRNPGRCDTTGLPLPPPRRASGGMPACSSDPAAADATALLPDGHVLRAQQHIGTLISELLDARGQPGTLTRIRQQLDDIYAVARAAISALHGPAPMPAVAGMVLAELGASPGTGGSPGRSAAIEALTSAAVTGPRRQSAPVVAFGATIADIMLHGRRDDPDPAIAAWIAHSQATRSTHGGPAHMIKRWSSTSPSLQAALMKPLTPRLDVLQQLRYGTPAGSLRMPGPAVAGHRAAAMPSLLWRGWALRLMPPEGFEALSCRAGLAVLLATAATGAGSYRTARELLGLQAVSGTRFAAFIARLRDLGVLETVLATLCQLSRKLAEHGPQIDYARRRQLPSLSQAQLDTADWRRCRYFLTRPGTLLQRSELARTELPACTTQEQLARLCLIEMLTGTHPYYLPGPLRLPERRSTRGPVTAYAEFVLTLPEPMANCLHRRAQYLLTRKSIREPVSWEPPFEWVTGITWPGPHPDDISPAGLHPLIRAGLPAQMIAAQLLTTPEHVRLTAARHPVPQIPPQASRAPARPGPAPLPSTEQLRVLTSQKLSLRAIARTTRCSEPRIRQALADAGLRQLPAQEIDPQWLHQQYQTMRRTLKDIAAETGISRNALAAAARAAGIPVRRGSNAHTAP